MSRAADGKSFMWTPEKWPDVVKPGTQFEVVL